MPGLSHGAYAGGMDLRGRLSADPPSRKAPARCQKTPDRGVVRVVRPPCGHPKTVRGHRGGPEREETGIRVQSGLAGMEGRCNTFTTDCKHRHLRITLHKPGTFLYLNIEDIRRAREQMGYSSVVTAEICVNSVESLETGDLGAFDRRFTDEQKGENTGKGNFVRKGS